MRLADFIDREGPAILAQWESFAASLVPAASGMDAAALRDHAEQILRTVADDLRTTQTPAQQSEKAMGRAPILPGTPETAAQTHALLRAQEGFDIRQMVAEYRALRASVLHLWAQAAPYGPDAIQDIGRFNEAIDQAIAESIDFFSAEVDRWRAIFLSVLGHDLRGPLNAVRMTAQAISAMSAHTPTVEHATRLIRSSERMAHLLDDLLDYNRTALHIGLRVEREPMDLTATCLQELELLRAALPRVTLEMTTTGDTHGQWDPSRIRQMVGNLVTNAAKYGAEGSAIRLNAQGEQAQVRLVVENTGQTIAPEKLGTLFEPLRRHATARSREEGQSLGLGLFIVREIAHAHGGHVEAHSADGCTRFTVTLPKH